MKISSLVTTVAAALLAATSIASAQNENTRQPNPPAQPHAGQQPDSSQGLGQGAASGDTARPNGMGVAPNTNMQPGGSSATTGQQSPPLPPDRGTVRPSESERTRPGDSSN